MSDMNDICDCGNLITEVDLEGYPEPCCGNCADLAYQKYRERQEWDHYHPTGDDKEKK